MATMILVDPKTGKVIDTRRSVKYAPNRHLIQACSGIEVTEGTTIDVLEEYRDPGREFQDVQVAYLSCDSRGFTGRVRLVGVDLDTFESREYYPFELGCYWNDGEEV
jgi:hypothetical protein